MQQPTDHNTRLRTTRMIWFGFTMSIGMFVFALFTTTQGMEAKPDTVMTYGPVFGGMALALLCAMPFSRKVITGAQTLPLLMATPTGPAWDAGLDPTQKEQCLNAAWAKYHQATMIGMAFCEAAVLFGFSLTFLAQMFILILPFAGAGLVMMVWQFPTEAGVFAVARTMREANSE